MNGWRDKPLHKRTQEAFPEQMLKFSVGRGHALVTGTQLLAAWLDVEANPEKADEVADSLLKCVGRYERYGDGSSALMTVPPSIEEESDS